MSAAGLATGLIAGGWQWISIGSLSLSPLSALGCCSCLYVQAHDMGRSTLLNEMCTSCDACMVTRCLAKVSRTAKVSGVMPQRDVQPRIQAKCWGRGKRWLDTNAWLVASKAPAPCMCCCTMLPLPTRSVVGHLLTGPWVTTLLRVALGLVGLMQQRLLHPPQQLSLSVGCREGWCGCATNWRLQSGCVLDLK